MCAVTILLLTPVAAVDLLLLQENARNVLSDYLFKMESVRKSRSLAAFRNQRLEAASTVSSNMNYSEDYVLRRSLDVKDMPQLENAQTATQAMTYMKASASLILLLMVDAMLPSC